MTQQTRKSNRLEGMSPSLSGYKNLETLFRANTQDELEHQEVYLQQSSGGSSVSSMMNGTRYQQNIDGNPSFRNFAQQSLGNPNQRSPHRPTGSSIHHNQQQPPMMNVPHNNGYNGYESTLQQPPINGHGVQTYPNHQQFVHGYYPTNQHQQGGQHQNDAMYQRMQALEQTISRLTGHIESITANKATPVQGNHSNQHQQHPP